MKAQLTFVRGKAEQAGHRPVVCFIPGGPGLSSATLRSMDILAKSFDLVYVDPPGTGGQEEVKAPTFSGIVEAIEAALLEVGRPLVLAGHSFGGLYVGELAFRKRLNCTGVVLIAAPLSADTYRTAITNYETLRSEELVAAEKVFEGSPNLRAFQSMLSKYGTIYFSEETLNSGSEMLLNDQASYQSALNLDTLALLEDLDLITKLKSISILKIVLAGKNDRLIHVADLEKEVLGADVKFKVALKSAHFVTYEQPEAVAQLIETTFERKKGEQII